MSHLLGVFQHRLIKTLLKVLTALSPLSSHVVRALPIQIIITLLLIFQFLNFKQVAEEGVGDFGFGLGHFW